MKKIVSMSVVMAVAFTVFGCSSSNGNKSVDSDKKKENIEVVFNSNQAKTDTVNLLDKYPDDWWGYDSSSKNGLSNIVITNESGKLYVQARRFYYMRKPIEGETAYYSYLKGARNNKTRYRINDNGSAVPDEYQSFGPKRILYNSGSDTITVYYDGNDQALFKRQKAYSNREMADILYDIQLPIFDQEERNGRKRVEFKHRDRTYKFPEDLGWNEKEK